MYCNLSWCLYVTVTHLLGTGMCMIQVIWRNEGKIIINLFPDDIYHFSLPDLRTVARWNAEGYATTGQSRRKKLQQFSRVTSQAWRHGAISLMFPHVWQPGQTALSAAFRNTIMTAHCVSVCVSMLACVPEPICVSASCMCTGCVYIHTVHMCEGVALLKQTSEVQNKRSDVSSDEQHSQTIRLLRGICILILWVVWTCTWYSW